MLFGRERGADDELLRTHETLVRYVDPTFFGQLGSDICGLFFYCVSAKTRNKTSLILFSTQISNAPLTPQALHLTFALYILRFFPFLLDSPSIIFSSWTITTVNLRGQISCENKQERVARNS